MVGSIPSNGFNVVREIERRGRRVQEKIVVETMPKKCTHFVFSKIRNNDKHNLFFYKKKRISFGDNILHTVTHSTHDVHMYVWYTTNCMHVHVCLVLYSMYVSHSRV